MYDVKTGVVLYLDGRYAEAARHFYEGAAEGDAEAAFHYGYMLLKGIGVEKNPAEAKSFFSFAVGYVGEAAYNLAVMHLHGEGVKRDYRKCIEYMTDAADMDIIEAQLYLGIAYTLGSVFEPDIISISLLPYHTPEFRDPLAVLEGDVPEMEEDEELRIRAVRFDPRTAFEYFRMAARHGGDYVEELAVQSKYLYARCFLDGLGTEFNLERANNLMLLAAAEGSKEAMAYLSTEAPYMLDKLDPRRVEAIRKTERLGGGRK
ncbi:MAG: sel1 repeat family protein [Clostridia bacterium]|nr:sel1 repeat family protein [Clostridia bacterium]